MSWFIQDAIVTFVALGALGVLVRRVTGMMRSKETTPGCTACPSCPAPRATQDDGNSTVPITIVNRRAQSRQPSGASE